MGLVNVAAEPYMDYGVTWDNEYVSLHMLEPDYSPMVGYPIAHTPGTDGKQVAEAVIVDLRSRADLDKVRGTLRGKMVLATPPARRGPGPAHQRRAPLHRRAAPGARADGDRAGARPGSRAPCPTPTPSRPTSAWRSSRPRAWWPCCRARAAGWARCAAIRRPGSKVDMWSRAGNLASPVIVAVTPEHYNRMYRIAQRGIPVRVELEVRNAIGDTVVKAVQPRGRDPGLRPGRRGRDAGRALRHVAREPQRERQHVGRGGGARGDAHPARDRGEAASHHSRGAVERRGAGAVRLARVRARALRQCATIRPSASSRRSTSSRPTSTRTTARGSTAASTCRATRCARSMLTAWMQPFGDLGMTVVSNQSVGSTDHIAVRRGRPAGLPVPAGPYARTGRPHQPGSARDHPAGRPHEERHDHGVVRVPRGDGG